MSQIRRGELRPFRGNVIDDGGFVRTNGDQNMQHDLAHKISELRLLHLADSALPIGALSHSFGLESLVAREILRVSDLPHFLRGYLEEAGFVEAVFCRAAHRLSSGSTNNSQIDAWPELNRLLSARKPARESCTGSAALGRNFLEAAIALINSAILLEALATARNPPNCVHHCTAFGLVSGVIGVDENRAVAAFLHQSIASSISACQRLLPLGQTEATRILWNLKPTLIEIADRTAVCSIDDACSFMPLLDCAAMEHPALSTRLFVS